VPLVNAHRCIAGSVGTPVTLAALLKEIHSESFNQSIIDIRINANLFNNFK
jgi:hypothetical protein